MPQNPTCSRPKRVLLMRLTAMGDVAMTAPLVAQLCLANPDVHFDFLTTPFFAPFFESLPNLTVVGTNIRKEKHGLLALWRLFISLKNSTFAPKPNSANGSECAIETQAIKGYDMVLDLHNVLRTQILRTLLWFTGAKVLTLDKGRSEKRALVKESNSSKKQLKLTTERYADVMRRSGLSLPNGLRFRDRMPLPSALFDALPDLKSCSGAHIVQKPLAERWIGISPYAQHKGKMYPAERMRQVMESLLEAPDVRLFVFGGGKAEKEAALQMTQGLPSHRVHLVIGVMTLADEMALMSNLDAMVSMDSSAMHICSLFGVRVVSVWGATHPYAGFLGYGQKEADVVQRTDLKCRPCSIFGNKPCKFGDYRCFDIAPSSIAEVVLRR